MEESGDPVDPPGPTFYEDILPVFVENCSACHMEGGIGPFDLEDYETSRALAELITVVTAERTMPPFNASNTGECRTFADARWLDDDEIDLIRTWTEAGAPEGDPETEFPERPEPTQLRGGDIVEVGTPEDYQPVADESGPFDDYQCFLGELNISDAPRYVVGYEVVPGNAAVTHHMVGFLVNLEGAADFGGTNLDRILARDAASPDQPGWDCFGAAGAGIVVEGTPVVWTPGGGAFNFPPGTGIRIDPGYALVLQTHYNLVNSDGTDHTIVRLAMKDNVEREAVNALADRYLATLVDTPVEIPAGAGSYSFSWTRTLTEFHPAIEQWDRVEILGLFPHMHEIGRSMRVNFVQGPDNDPVESCGIEVDRWDFQWQNAYMYEQPVRVRPGTRLDVTCEWDASDRDVPTGPGLGTMDEMCLVGVYAVEAPPQ